MRQLVLLVAVASLMSPARPDGARASVSRYAIVVAEDARAPTPAALQVLVDGTRSPDPALQVLAVRALGRLERPELAETIVALLSAASAAVRAEAANALGQAVTRAPERAAATLDLLAARLGVERDPFVRGILCETLGRLPYAAKEEAARAEMAIMEAGWGLTPSSLARRGEQRVDAAPARALVGALQGLETLFRLRIKMLQPARTTIDRLRVLAGAQRGALAGGTQADAARVRRLAVAALVAARDTEWGVLGAALADPDEQTRRLAVVGLGAIEPPPPNLAAFLDRALRDASPIVRYEALRVYGRRLQATGCGPVLSATRDASPHVALLAIDLLGAGCADSDEAVNVLERIVDRLGEVSAASRNWHGPAHALVAMARIDRDRVSKRLGAFAGHPIWQVRMYAARAAAALGQAEILRRLAGDANDNVREAALAGLGRLPGHGADDLALAALERSDYQLIMTAARMLAGTPDRKGAAAALMSALARLTAEDRDTSRDPRLAILERLREVGSAELASPLERYLADFDPRVARLAAEVLAAWTGHAHVPQTTRMRTSPPPSPEEVREQTRLGVRMTIRGVGSCELELDGETAPATVARIVRLARAGYYNGLTFHRIVPNFVIQGGSPGANEYAGDGSYMRDELGLMSHLRGTLGISTRGRDTGDAQLFINLVDNYRLDHEYTVFGRVTQGMETVDAMIEGDVIERIDILGPQAKR